MKKGHNVEIYFLFYFKYFIRIYEYVSAVVPTKNKVGECATFLCVRKRNKLQTTGDTQLTFQAFDLS